MHDRRWRLAALLILLAGTGLGIWWFLQERAIPDAPLSPAQEEPAAVTGLEAPPSRTSDVTRSENAAPAPAEPAAVDSAPAKKQLAVVRGRCLRAEDRGPIEGAVAKFDGRGGNSTRVAMQGQVEWKDPEPVTTDAEGCFEIEFDPPSGFQFGFDVASNGRVPRTGRWGRIEPQQVIDLGDIELAMGYEVRGRVVDELGMPVAKIGVSLKNLPLPIGPGMAANNQRSGWSDERGEFVVQVPIPAGTWSLEAQGAGMKHVSPDRAEVLPNAGCEPLVVSVKKMPKIEGIVVDDLGEPVERVYIHGEHEGRTSGRMTATYSRKDGTFVLYSVEDGQGPIRLSVMNAMRCEPPETQDPTRYEWGTKDIRIALRRAQTFELTVVEKGSGVPVTSYAVQCYSDRAMSSNEREPRLSGQHDGGRVTVDRVWRGKNRVIVQTHDAALLPNEAIEFEVGDAALTPIRVELERMAPYVVRATTSTGEPIEGAEIEVIEKGTDELDPSASVNDRFRGSGSFSSDPRWRGHELLSSAKSDATGRASVLAPRGERALAVRGRHATFPPLLVAPAVFEADRELVLVFASAATIRGRVIYGGLDPLRIQVQAQSTDSTEGKRRRVFGGDLNRDVRGDGTFEFSGLAAGTYSLTLSYSVQYEEEGGGGGMRPSLDLPSVPVVATAGETAEVVLDASAHSPGKVYGRALLDGAPPPSARLVLAWKGTAPLPGSPDGRMNERARFGQFVPDSNGSFVAEHLLPGKYSANLVLGDYRVGSGRALKSDTEFELTAGQELRLDLLFVHRRLILRLLDRDGVTPLASTKVSWGSESGSGEATTDSNGVLVLEPVQIGEISLSMLDPRGDLNRYVSLGKVSVPAAANSHEATIVRPVEDKR